MFRPPFILTSPVLILILLVPTATTTTNFTACWDQLKKAADSGLLLDSITNNYGQQTDAAHASSMTYRYCAQNCGSGPESFQWPLFSQQFGSWLLPWLALISQLPFGANDKLDNLVSMLLTVGSPTLAAYSLALTVLNGRWVASRFASINYPNTRNAVRILSSLQQSPLKVTSEGSLLSSLVVLPENDEWWSELVNGLNYTYTWSISAATSIAWVIIAYVFTVIDSFSGDLSSGINESGQGVGSAWLWLLPIVLGWLQISPKCNSDRLFAAVKRANMLAYVAPSTPSDRPVLAGSVSRQYAISLAPDPGDLSRRDEGCTVPIFNYSRFLPWVQAVETVADAFRAASERADQHHPVNEMVEWKTTDNRTPYSEPSVAPANRRGSRAQADEYCAPLGENSSRQTAWGYDIWTRVLIASAFALGLQWGTTGAAIVVVYFTPTTGLGCRSGAYLLYGIMATIVWLLLVLSSFLSHYSATAAPAYKLDLKVRTARWLSIIFRFLGKTMASLNAVGIVVTCLFQFSNFFDRCWCNSSVLGRGASKAFNVFVLLPEDISDMRNAWSLGVALAAGSAIIFVGFVNIFINPQLPVGN